MNYAQAFKAYFAWWPVENITDANIALFNETLQARSAFIKDELGKGYWSE